MNPIPSSRHQYDDAMTAYDAAQKARELANATNADTWRTVAQASERSARIWEAIARNVAGATPDGWAVLRRQMVAHGLFDHAPTDSEGAES